jgi:hypothetical protein
MAAALCVSMRGGGIGAERKAVALAYAAWRNEIGEKRRKHSINIERK